MNEAVNYNVKKMDYVFMCAAIADFLPLQKSNEKIKRSSNDLIIKLQPAPDILKSIHGKSKAIIIAFALETHHGEKEALTKLNDKKADYIILNYANEKGAGFDSNTNHVTIFSKNGKNRELKKDQKDISYIITDLDHKNSLLTQNIDLDFIEILIREKFLFGKKDETTYIIKKNGNKN